MLYFVRHGQTDWNVAEKVQGTSDIELNETGIAQAEELAKELKDVDIDLIICSPLKRARKTAEIINKNKNCKLIVDEDFTERHFGEFEGKTRKEFPVADFWNYKENFKYQKAECIGDFFSRVYKALDRIKENVRKRLENVELYKFKGSVSKLLGLTLLYFPKASITNSLLYSKLF